MCITNPKLNFYSISQRFTFPDVEKNKKNEKNIKKKERNREKSVEYGHRHG